MTSKNEMAGIMERSWYQSCVLWVRDNKVLLPSGDLDFGKHKYQLAILECNDKTQVIKKAAQLGFTTMFMLKAIHGLKHGKYRQGVLYLFPTGDDVSDFSKSRFTPLIMDNFDSIGQHVKDTDNVQVKRIGLGTLFLRGARLTGRIQGTKKTSSRLKSVPVDCIIEDERDEMEDEAIDLAKERVSHSEIQQEIQLSTPSIPNFGVDMTYQRSDQRVWMIRCQHCGHDTCLELEFPNCLEEDIKNGTVHRVCMKCRKEIFPHHGHWEALFPARSKDITGWWISQLNSFYIDPKRILHDFREPPHGNLAEVYNSKLGLAYISSKDQLTVDDIYRICGHKPFPAEFPGPAAMGVDVGAKLHVVIAFRPAEVGLEMIFCGEFEKFEELYDLGKRMGVTSCVVDVEPEQRAARDFATFAPFEVYLCDYRDSQRGAPAFQEDSTMVYVNRTEICDATHDLITTAGRFLIPRKTEEIVNYAKMMCGTAKVLKTDDLTGSSAYTYIKLGPDHYYHATNYMLLAAMRIGIHDPNLEKFRDRKRDAWDSSFTPPDEDTPKKNWMYY